ncbi:MAG TPA: hypothetical protein VJY62_17530 [Bacteroidia bacterium]|nr:hypothetical protein [Bacteroidia bacterium]
MKKSILLSISLIALAGLGYYAWSSYTNKSCCKASSETASLCSHKCTAKTASNNLSCKLTSPELQQRKTTVIASLKSQVVEKKELENGYAYKFIGSDKVVDELTEFIKSERQCCDFFTFNLSISGDKSEAWLELIGPKGAKDFIFQELDI